MVHSPTQKCFCDVTLFRHVFDLLTEWFLVRSRMVFILHGNEYSGQRHSSVSLPEIPVGEQVSVRADI